MKYKGKKLSGPNVETVVIPRGNGEDLVFTCQAVLDYTRFRALVPDPKPGKKMLPGGKIVDDTEDRGFLAQQEQWAKLHFAYTVIESLKSTNDMEWETVKLDDPSTWLNWDKEFSDAGFTLAEQNMIAAGIAAANGLSQDKIDEARNRFLASRIQQAVSSSPTGELLIIQSGEPAKG
jgi:hypothetical protein